MLPPVTQPFQGFAISIIDFRLGTGGGGDGLVAGLIPDMRDMPGFMLKVGFEAPDHVIVEGGGKIPIQQTIGPLDVVALMIDLRENSLSVGIDLSFQLSVIRSPSTSSAFASTSSRRRTRSRSRCSCTGSASV